MFTNCPLTTTWGIPWGWQLGGSQAGHGTVSHRVCPQQAPLQSYAQCVLSPSPGMDKPFPLPGMGHSDHQMLL